MHGQGSSGRTTGGMNDRTGQPGVESALGRDRTKDGDLPRDLGTNRSTTSSGSGAATDSTPLDVRQVADQAQQQVGQAVGFAQEQVTARLGGQIGHAAESLQMLSRSVTSMGEQLREQDQGMLAQAAEMAAGRIEGVSGYLRNRDFDEIVRDTERFARRQPMLFLGGALTLGMLASRFLKASTPQNPQPSYQGQFTPARTTGSYAPAMPYASQPTYSGTTTHSGMPMSGGTMAQPVSPPVVGTGSMTPRVTESPMPRPTGPTTPTGTSPTSFDTGTSTDV